jgi:hypothetical protein
MERLGVQVSDNSAPHVKITMNDLYKEQQETNKLLVKTVAHLETLADVPDRLRAVEVAQARGAWVEKIAYSALGGAIIAVGTVIISSISKA